MTSADEVLARLDRETAEAVNRARQAQQFRASLDALRGRASADGVTAVVDATGMLVSLERPENLARWSGSRLGPRVMEIVRLAQADVAELIRQQTDEAWGADSSVAERMRSELSDRFGTDGSGR